MVRVLCIDENCVAAVRRAAKHLGLSHRDIVSGAGHDACYIARVAPTEVAIVADGSRLEVLPASVASVRPEFRIAADERRTISYPVLRAVRSLALQVRVGARQQSDLVTVPSS